jgi:hypothetical protein
MPISQAQGQGDSQGSNLVPAIFFDPKDALKNSVHTGNASAFSAASSFMNALSNAVLRASLTRELRQIKPVCDATIANWAEGLGGKCYDPHDCGIVIIEVVCVTPGPIGTSPTMAFWSIFYGDCGLNANADATINQYLKDRTIMSGYPAIPPGSEPRWLIFWYGFEMPHVTAVGTR